MPFSNYNFKTEGIDRTINIFQKFDTNIFSMSVKLLYTSICMHSTYRYNVLHIVMP